MIPEFAARLPAEAHPSSFQTSSQEDHTDQFLRNKQRFWFDRHHQSTLIINLKMSKSPYQHLTVTQLKPSKALSQTETNLFNYRCPQL